MANGLLLNEEEFSSLPQKEQHLVLYRNQVKTIEKMQEMNSNCVGCNKAFNKVKNQTNIQWILIGTIGAGVVWILNTIISHISK